MLSRVNLGNLKSNIDDSHIDTPVRSHFFYTKRAEITDESGFTSDRAAQHIAGKSKNYRSNNRRRFWRKDPSSTTLKAQKGMSFIDVVVAMLILSVLIIGGHYHFVYGRCQVALQRNYRAALRLASQQLEELKAGNYDNITDGTTEETLTLGDYACTRTTDANDVGGLYKKINVQINWNQTGREHNVSLDTFMAPKW